jgi:hypothetical protein
MMTLKNGLLSSRRFLILITFFYGILNGVELFAVPPKCVPDFKEGGTCDIDDKRECRRRVDDQNQICICLLDSGEPATAKGKWNCYAAKNPLHQ